MFWGGMIIGLILGACLGILAIGLVSMARENGKQDNETICFDIGCGHRRRG